MKNLNPTQSRLVSNAITRAIIFATAAGLLSGTTAFAQQSSPVPAQSQVMTTTPETPKIPNDQLDSLVAPIALYPDPLLAQTLAASTYPLEIIQLQQWMKKNPNLKDKALAEAVEKQKWDPSVQAMAAFPDVVKKLGDNIAWTTDLGNAFLAQQADTMDAVQRMRTKALNKGTLKTSQQQKVETQTASGGKQVIVIQQTSPTVVYVPVYDPVVVYGVAVAVYPYPPIYYPPYYPGATALAFGAGVALGAAWGGGWGWGCGWGHNDVEINVNNKYVNNFNKTNNINNVNRGQGNNSWQHNPQHRAGTPYGDRNTANRYGNGARQQPATGAQRPGGGASGTGNTGAANRPSTMPASGNRTASGLGSSNSLGSSGGERVGNRSVAGGSSGFGGSNNAFGGSGGFGGDSARSASSRGASSFGGGREFGGGGGGRAGGARGGGGGRRR